MADILIRNVPAATVVALDRRASRLGLSRADFLRRQLQVEASRDDTVAVTVADLVFLGDLVVDLTDEAVMRDAWS